MGMTVAVRGPLGVASLGLLLFLWGCTATPIAGPAPTSTATPTSALREELFAQRRLEMVVEQIEERGVVEPRLLAAMTKVPRHRFVPQRYVDQAYEDHPLPIGEGQTISQPYIVALMTDLLDVQPGEKVLEIGTGSGYQAAVLAEMDAQVYTIEIIPLLAERARATLDSLGYRDVHTKVGDGYFGWQEHAPFDGIMVTAAPDHIPPPLLEQLKPTGKMVIPVGPPGGVQTLWLLEQREGEWVSFNMGAVRFVPFLREPP